MTKPNKKNARRRQRGVKQECHTTTKPCQLVATDADGTLWQFWWYFAPAMRKIIPVLAERLGLSMDQVSTDIGTVMDKYGTHEFPWALELTDFRKTWKGTAQQFREQIAEPFWAALDHFRLAYLELMRDVPETLSALSQRGIKLVILSDAPMHMALSRAHQMQVGGYVDAIYALDTPEPALSEFVDPFDIELGRERVSRFMSTPINIRRVVLDRKFEKPHPHGLQQILTDYAVDPLAVRFVGDNRGKDGGVAAALGVPYISADYGTYLSPEDRKIIEHKFKSKNAKGDSAHNPTASKKKDVPMVAEAASYKTLLNHLGVFNMPTVASALTPSAASKIVTQCGH